MSNVTLGVSLLLVSSYQFLGKLETYFPELKLCGRLDSSLDSVHILSNSTNKGQNT